MKHPLPIFIESSNKQRSADYNVDICILNTEGHERFHSRHNNDVLLCYHIKPPGTPTKTILIRIPCHNSSYQDAVASIGFNSALIPKLTVVPKLCYPETPPSCSSYNLPQPTNDIPCDLYEKQPFLFLSV